MGFEGLKARFLAWMQARWTTFPEFAESFADDISANVSTLVVGTADTSTPPNYFPPAPGEKIGEIFISDNLGPPEQAWIWDGGSWIRIG